MDCYLNAIDEYKKLGVDVEKAIATASGTAVSIHCWQGDDVGGFEHEGAKLDGGGIQVTGNYPGKARTLEELRQDLEKMMSLVPGKKRVNIHASYADFAGGPVVDRDKLEPKHFDSWIKWAKGIGLDGIDFNGTFFSHPMADSGYTLSSKDEKVREFWIRHEMCCRKIADYIGRQMGSTCILNTWIPDGAKDYTADKIGYRRILKESLDRCFAVKYDNMKDAVETKLFGIGSEEFTVGSHEFYMNYASRSGVMVCIDMGHFHTGEDISDKLSSILLFDDELLMHISRPMRWDSDHVVVFNEAVQKVAMELVRSGKLNKVHIGLDYFDASINRIGAWTIGARSFQKALLFALLMPDDKLIEYEEKGDGFAKLALYEQMKVMPFEVVWNEYCRRSGAVAESGLIDEIHRYEKEVTGVRL